MEQNPSWEANQFEARQDFTPILEPSTVYYRVCLTLPNASILRTKEWYQQEIVTFSVFTEFRMDPDLSFLYRNNRQLLTLLRIVLLKWTVRLKCRYCRKKIDKTDQNTTIPNTESVMYWKITYISRKNLN